MLNKYSRFSQFINVLGLIFPWLVLIFLFYKYSLDLPLRDDYRLFISIQKIYLNADSWLDKLHTIFLPENESYPILMRLIMVGQMQLDGSLNFLHMLLFCWTFILIVWSIFWKNLSNSIFFKSIFGLWLLNILNYEYFFRTDVATYQLTAFAISIFAMYSATKFKKSSNLLKIAFVFSYIFILSGSINGIFASVLILLYFLIKVEKKGLIWTSSILILQLILLYLGKGEGKSIGIIENLIKYNYELIIAYFMSLGGVFYLSQTPAFQTISGILGLIIFLFTFYQLFFNKKDIVNFKSMLFIFSALSLAAIVGLRYNYWLPGYNSVFESRYKIYGITIFILGLSEFLEKFKSKFLNSSILILSVFMYFSGIYKGTFMLKNQQLTQITDAYNVGADCLNQSYADKYLASNIHARFLKNKNAFDFYKKKENIESLLKPENKLSISKIIFSKDIPDPLSMGDWAKTETPLSRIEAFGNFPKYNYYLIRFNLKNGKKALHFLLPPIQSFRQNLTGSVNQYSKLSHEYYFEIFEGLNPEDAEIYGVNEIKM